MILDTVPDIKKHLGARIRAFRRAKALSQDELGSAAQLSRNAIQAIEKGRAWPRYENLKGMAARLEVDPLELFKDSQGADLVEYAAIEKTAKEAVKEAFSAGEKVNSLATIAALLTKLPTEMIPLLLKADDLALDQCMTVLGAGLETDGPKEEPAKGRRKA